MLVLYGVAISALFWAPAMLCTLLLLALCGQPTVGEPTPEAPTVDGSESLAALIRSIALAQIPAEYVNEKEWGQQKAFTTQLKVSLDGLRVDSERRKKLLNHGTWKRYEIRQAKSPDSLQLSVDGVRQLEDGRLHFDVLCRAKLDLEGRVAQWERGVQLLSLGAEADATVLLRAGCDLAIQIDPLKLPPDVILKPVVTDARIDVEHFRLRSVGQLDGPVVRQLGRALREAIDDQVADRNRDLADKLNRQITKKQDKLRLSLADWIEKKAKLTGLKSAPTEVPQP